jgi:D-serine deaminase-like pyridoxal phosphate-dependent protein
MSNTFLIFEQRTKENLRALLTKCKQNQCNFRPHFKTHQNPVVSQWFMQEGVKSITVSSLDMAYQFAQEGWEDIFIAFPLDINEVEELEKLASMINLRILITHSSQIQALENLNVALEFMIEVDVGYHRSGIPFQSYQQVLSLIEESHNNKNLIFSGLMAHFGNTYQARSQQQIKGIAEKSMNRLVDLGTRIERERGEFVYLSIGDTPSASILNDFVGIHELRPGNFIFYDQMQLQIGSCDLQRIAAVMECSVVDKYEDRLIIHGGAVHFSKEISDYQNVRNYGFLVDTSGAEWKLHKSYLSSLSQEHGTVFLAEEERTLFEHGSQVHILPVHSCLTANLMKNNFTIIG